MLFPGSVGVSPERDYLHGCIAAGLRLGPRVGAPSHAATVRTVNPRPSFVAALAVSLMALGADRCEAAPMTEAQRWEALRVAFVACRDAKGATAQHTCAAHYADLALELYGDTTHASTTHTAYRRTSQRLKAR